MGNGIPQSKPDNQWDWQENQNGIEIYRHKIDGRIAEKRRIALPVNSPLQKQIQIYKFREQNTNGLTKSYDVSIIDNPIIKQKKVANLCKCSNQTNYVDVYTERIPYRLSEFPQLTFPQGLQILNQSLASYEVIYQKVGGVHINPQLIGITQQGEVRCWVNENWALNQPSHYIPTLKSTCQQNYQQIDPHLRDQSQMIANIVDVISQKTEQGRFPSPFSQNLKAKSNSFKSIRKYLNQYLTTQNKNQIPTLIKRSKVGLDGRQIYHKPTTFGSSIRFAQGPANYNGNNYIPTNQTTIPAPPSYVSFPFESKTSNFLPDVKIQSRVEPVLLKNQIQFPYSAYSQSRIPQYKPTFSGMNFNQVSYYPQVKTVVEGPKSIDSTSSSAENLLFNMKSFLQKQEYKFNPSVINKNVGQTEIPSHPEP